MAEKRPFSSRKQEMIANDDVGSKEVISVQMDDDTYSSIDSSFLKSVIHKLISSYLLSEPIKGNNTSILSLIEIIP